MVQLGWNAGPRHARVWGLAKSFTASLPEDELQRRDRDCVALLSMVWALIRTHMPRESVDAFENALDEAGMPRLNTRSLQEELAGKLGNSFVVALTYVCLRPRLRIRS